MAMTGIVAGNYGYTIVAALDTSGFTALQLTSAFVAGVVGAVTPRRRAPARPGCRHD